MTKDTTTDMTRDGGDVEALTRALARVEPGSRGADPSGAGARTLLASIVAAPAAEDPLAGVSTSGSTVTPLRRRGLGRLAAGLAVAAALAGGIVVGPSLLGKGGATPSYAVTKDDHGVVTIQVRDFSDADGLRRRLEELGVPAIVDYVPLGKRCERPRTGYVEDVPRGLYSLPESIPGETMSWQMRIDTRLFRPGETFVWTIGEGGTSTILMKNPVRPCEFVPDRPPLEEVDGEGFRLATTEGGSLAGYRVDGKTVGEVVPEIRKRGLKVTFMVMSGPDGLGERYLQGRTSPISTVGDDWVVWDALDARKGEVFLCVSKQRYDRNPLFGGPRDAVIKD
ncbi:hypothetical protein HTZ77_39595 [Nonomuraea sp. SMC257]|uniref:Uncharacterized protein n=1 Tax=Nonomuraea montanisoli TaxID=2741721 RepID=A0A7Y6IG38_9ACTN|nr:hypothetical protein [Nonomuraea montanisoli]NUW37461.1 hypothetical protein [Nonomuraea montanisoli]